MLIIFRSISIYRNQSARELSHFAESAMAVKRVILQHFSMRYDYMTRERPNIYQPSSHNSYTNRDSDEDSGIMMGKLKDNNDDDTTTIETSTTTSNNSDNNPINVPDDNNETNITNNKQNFNIKCDDDADEVDIVNDVGRVEDVYGDEEDEVLDGIMVEVDDDDNREEEEDDSITKCDDDEMSDKHTEMYRDTAINTKQQFNNKIKSSIKNCSNGINAKENYYNIAEHHFIRPEENWRYRCSNGTDDKKIIPLGFRHYRNVGNNHFNNSSSHNNNINNTSNSRYKFHHHNHHNQQQPQNHHQHQSGQNSPRAKQYHHNYGTNSLKHYYGGGDYYRKSGSGSNNDVECKNWRNECFYRPTRNCGFNATNDTTGLVINDNRGSGSPNNGSPRRDFYRNGGGLMNDDIGDNNRSGGLSAGLSPPSESLLMQRRLRRSSDILMRGPLPATASG